MRSDQISAVRRHAADCRQAVAAAIDEQRGLYSSLVRRHYEQQGRCILYLNEELPLPEEVLRDVEGVDMSTAIDQLQTYDPATEGAILWVPMSTAERYGGPDDAGIMAGTFELHPAVRKRVPA